jgi:hypothetical protein
MQAQRGALDVQIVIAGLARFGSSKVPTRTKIKCGRASASLKSGVPQPGQNRRCIRLPLSATLKKSLVFPVTLKVSVRKQAPTVPLPAPKYWQSRHQHTRVVIGGSVLSQRTAPQRHRPVTVIALSTAKLWEMLSRRSYSWPLAQFQQCRLTLPSRGPTKGYAFCGPLMSNVRRPKATRTRPRGAELHCLST